MLSVLEETAVQDRSGRDRVDERAIGANSNRLIGRRMGFYRIESVLGQGSMACVYKAKHLGLHRPCALKILDTDLVGEQTGEPGAVLGRGARGREPPPSPRGDDP